MTRREALIALRDKVKAGRADKYDGPPWHELFDGHVQAQSVANAYYLGSLDAAKALHDAVLPGCRWFVGHLDEPSLGYVATVAEGHFADSPSWRCYDIVPARAWLLAILSALIAQEPPA
jgi:hypothetical protein